MELSGARILVTGGGRGIGRSISLALMKKVEQVVVIDKDADLLAALPVNDRLIKLQCDLTNSLEVQQTIATIFSSHGGINVCINNAGIIHSEPLINLLSKSDKKHSMENWKKVIDVNLNSLFYVTANVTEQMVNKRVKGLVINISSISAQGNAGQSVYSATKAAVEALTKTWSKELGIFKIRCACIAPGFFSTSSTKESLSESMLVKWQKSVPLGRLGELEEIVSAVEFIIANDYFNGKILALDGGLTL